MDNQKFLEKLNGYIRKAFDNEEEFLARFCPDGFDDELIECYMASERVYICIGYRGGHTTTTIPTSEFIAWCEEGEE